MSALKSLLIGTMISFAMISVSVSPYVNFSDLMQGHLLIAIP